MNVPALLRHTDLRLKVMMVPWIIVKGVPVGEPAGFPVADKAAKDGRLTGTFTPKDQEPLAHAHAHEGGMVLEAGLQQLIDIRVDATETDDGT